MSGDEPAWTMVAGPAGLDLAVQLAGEPPIVVGVRLTGPRIRSDDLRAIRLSAIEADAISEHLDRPDALPPLHRGMEAGPHEFSRVVAEYYQAWSVISRNPVAAMAKAYGLKPPTVHTWVREARLRGHLPPGTRGKGVAG